MSVGLEKCALYALQEKEGSSWKDPEKKWGRMGWVDGCLEAITEMGPFRKVFTDPVCR